MSNEAKLTTSRKGANHLKTAGISEFAQDLYEAAGVIEPSEVTTPGTSQFARTPVSMLWCSFHQPPQLDFLTRLLSVNTSNWVAHPSLKPQFSPEDRRWQKRLYDHQTTT